MKTIVDELDYLKEENFRLREVNRKLISRCELGLIYAQNALKDMLLPSLITLTEDSILDIKTTLKQAKKGYK